MREPDLLPGLPGPAIALEGRKSTDNQGPDLWFSLPNGPLSKCPRKAGRAWRGVGGQLQVGAGFRGVVKGLAAGEPPASSAETVTIAAPNLKGPCETYEVVRVPAQVASRGFRGLPEASGTEHESNKENIKT